MTVVRISDGVEMAAPGEPDMDLLEFVEALMERVLSGRVVALGTVEVEVAGKAAVGFCHKDHYHELNSGAARLSGRLATIPGGGDG